MFAALLRRLSFTGFRRGLSGSNLWLVVGIVAAGLRALRSLARSDSNQDVLYRTVVRPGDVFEVITRPKTK